MKFEWDINKDKINQKKHKISFSTAKLIFQDENRLDFPDFNHSITEERRVVIGKVRHILFVCYTMRGEDTIRIISARKATKREEMLYYDNNGIFGY